MAATEVTTVSVTPETRNQLRSLKRGGQSYDDLLREMVEQYNPDSN